MSKIVVTLNFDMPTWFFYVFGTMAIISLSLWAAKLGLEFYILRLKRKRP